MKERQGGRERHNQSKPNQPEQPPYGGGFKSSERRPLPSVWDILERKVKLSAPDVKDRPRWGSDEYKREVDELNRLEKEIDEKATARDKLILDLYDTIIMEPTGTLPVPVDWIDLSLEDFSQFRSQVEPMSEKEIGEEIRQANVEFQRKLEATRSRRTDPDESYSLARK
jgi:hypothetical protein